MTDKTQKTTQKQHPDPFEYSQKPNYIVGIGASAGGLEALQNFFSVLARGSGAAFVVVQHLSPDYKSLMVELLSKYTPLHVRHAESNLVVQPESVYLIPPKYNLIIRDGTLFLTEQEQKNLNLPIDIFFQSLAEDQGAHAIGIVLSGAGSDGTRGIRAIKEVGGVVMVQDEHSAKFSGMPGSAIATGLADYILAASEMPEQLMKLLKRPHIRLAIEPNLHEINDSALEKIISLIRDRTDMDFSVYKYNTLLRRIERRMGISQTNDLGNYLSLLHSSQREVDALAKDLLINVTKFFRDAEVFHYLAENIIPNIVSKHLGKDPIRIWILGCATGEEAYSVGMLFEEYLFKHQSKINFKIFATDLDKDSVDFAANGIYPVSIAADIPQPFLEKYFTNLGDSYQVCRRLRERIVFAKQNVLRDPPFTKLDFVSCRNLMIYLQPSAQKKLLSLVYFGLNTNGYLMLGTSETVGELHSSFETIDGRFRIFQRREGGHLSLADTLRLSSSASSPSKTRELPSTSDLQHNRFWEQVKDKLIDEYVPAGFVINERLEILHSIGKTPHFITLPRGRITWNLAKMLPRDLSLALTTATSRVRQEHKKLEYKGIAFDIDNEFYMIDLVVEEVPNNDIYSKTFLVLFAKSLAEPLTLPTEKSPVEERLLQRIADLEKDLQDTRVSLQTALEERESTNEELQATNEELLSSNEELQSTNEELESVNEELYTVNTEYQGKIQQLIELNDDLDNFLQSTDIGVIFLDSDLRLRKFTPAITREINLLMHDIGRPLNDLAHPLINDMLDALRELQTANQSHIEKNVMTNNVWYLMQARPFKRHMTGNHGFVITLVNITFVREMQMALQASERRWETILETVPVGICVTDAKGHFVAVNPSYCNIYGYNKDEIIGESFLKIVLPEQREEAQKMHDYFIETGEEIPTAWNVMRRDGKVIPIHVRATLLVDAQNQRFKVTIVEQNAYD